jgi:hypothetical protein
MTQATLTEIVEAADQLSPEDQEDLIDILQKRLHARRRAALERDVQEAQKEFAEGKCQRVTPGQLMEEILS